MLRNRSVKYEYNEDIVNNGLLFKQSFLEVKESYGDTIKYGSPIKKNESLTKSRNFINPFDRKLTSFSVSQNVKFSQEPNQNIQLTNNSNTLTIKKIKNKSISSSFPNIDYNNQFKITRTINNKEYDSYNKNNISPTETKIFSNSERKEKSKIDYIRERKTSFLKKQREYLIQHTKYKTDRILLPNLHKGNTTDNLLLNDVYKSSNELSNEPEYVKKFIIPPIKIVENKLKSLDSNENLSNKIHKTTRSKRVILHQLLPKDENDRIKKGYTIKIQQKGGDYIYQIVKESEKKEKFSSRKIDNSLINRFKKKEMLKNVKSISEAISPMKMRVSTIEFNELPNVYSTVNKYFKEKKIKSDYFTKLNEDKLNETIKIKIDNLDDIKKSIQTTLDNAVTHLFKKEHI
jgi:hypothetical protein